MCTERCLRSTSWQPKGESYDVCAIDAVDNISQHIRVERVLVGQHTLREDKGKQLPSLATRGATDGYTLAAWSGFGWLLVCLMRKQRASSKRSFE